MIQEYYHHRLKGRHNFYANKATIAALFLLASLGIARHQLGSDTGSHLEPCGIWEGTGNGQPGVSKVQREYRIRAQR